MWWIVYIAVPVIPFGILIWYWTMSRRKAEEERRWHDRGTMIRLSRSTKPEDELLLARWLNEHPDRDSFADFRGASLVESLSGEFPGKFQQPIPEIQTEELYEAVKSILCETMKKVRHWGERPWPRSSSLRDCERFERELREYCKLLQVLCANPRPDLKSTLQTLLTDAPDEAQYRTRLWMMKLGDRAAASALVEKHLECLEKDVPSRIAIGSHYDFLSKVLWKHPDLISKECLVRITRLKDEYAEEHRQLENVGDDRLEKWEMVQGIDKKTCYVHLKQKASAELAKRNGSTTR